MISNKENWHQVPGVGLCRVVSENLANMTFNVEDPQGNWFTVPHKLFVGTTREMNEIDDNLLWD